MFYLGWLLVGIGLFFVLSGVIGLIRFTGFYNKLHAASVIDSCGVPISLFGLALLQSDFASFAKLLFAAVLVFILNPVATFALGRASIESKVDKEGRVR